MKRTRAQRRVEKADHSSKEAMPTDNISKLEIPEEDVPIKKLSIDNSTVRITSSGMNADKNHLSQRDSDDSLINRQLNDYCLIKIFSKLGIIDKIRIERVCKLWQALSKQSWTSMKRFDYTSTTWGSQLYFRKKLNIATLRYIFKRCGKYITILDLGTCLYGPTVTITLQTVGKFCPNLEEVYTQEHKLTSSAISSLTNNCKKIKVFLVGNILHKECDDDLAQLFIANAELENLDIECNNRVTGKCLEYLSADKTKKIALRSCTSLTPEYLNQALQKFNNLTGLQLQSCRGLNDATLKVIGEKITLDHLEISGDYPKLSLNGMNNLANLENIKELRLYDNEAVTDKFLINISKKCPHLELLLIDSCTRVTNVGVASLAKLIKLKVLSINAVDRVSDRAIKNLNMLEFLSCAQCTDITNEGIIRFVEITSNLRTLDISGRLLTESLYKKLRKIMKRRTNNNVLQIFIDDADYEFEDSSPEDLHKQSPLLLFEYVNY